MKLSMKSDYALRALLTLVEHYGGEPLSIRELAARNDIPKRYLEQIMLDLKGKGWVKSLPGRDGGFLLARPPTEISMGQVIRHFDEVLAPISCVSANKYEPCTQESVCRFRRVLLQVRNLTARLLDNSTLAKVFSGQPVEKEEVFFQGFMGGAGI
ncbi:MAG: Rrf2 family transcriptional regulator [Nitrospinae bacterium]|nr:Rrf2 family transcriptional regulator [Nitrospinota bacterium]